MVKGFPMEQSFPDLGFPSTGLDESFSNSQFSESAIPVQPNENGLDQFSTGGFGNPSSVGFTTLPVESFSFPGLFPELDENEGEIIA